MSKCLLLTSFFICLIKYRVCTDLSAQHFFGIAQPPSFYSLSLKPPHIFCFFHFPSFVSHSRFLHIHFQSILTFHLLLVFSFTYFHISLFSIVIYSEDLRSFIGICFIGLLYSDTLRVHQLFFCCDTIKVILF